MYCEVQKACDLTSIEAVLFFAASFAGLELASARSLWSFLAPLSGGLPC